MVNVRATRRGWWVALRRDAEAKRFRSPLVRKNLPGTFTKGRLLPSLAKAEAAVFPEKLQAFVKEQLDTAHLTDWERRRRSPSDL
jgi:hypothetical protein